LSVCLVLSEIEEEIGFLDLIFPQLGNNRFVIWSNYIFNTRVFICKEYVLHCGLDAEASLRGFRIERRCR
jgi:hypothetical protein